MENKKNIVSLFEGKASDFNPNEDIDTLEKTEERYIIAIQDSLFEAFGIKPNRELVEYYNHLLFNKTESLEDQSSF